MIPFLVGLVVGAAAGVFFIALSTAASEVDFYDTEGREDYETER